MKILAKNAEPKQKPSRMFNIHVSFAPEVHEKLTRMAKEQGRPLANMVRHLVNVALAHLDERR